MGRPASAKKDEACGGAGRFPTGGKKVDPGRHEAGRPTPAGVYLAVLTANGERRTQRLVRVN
jgi:hypothetical protein